MFENFDGHSVHDFGKVEGCGTHLISFTKFIKMGSIIVSLMFVELSRKMKT